MIMRPDFDRFTVDAVFRKLFLASLFVSYSFAPSLFAQDGESSFTVERLIAADGFDGKQCWVHARAGAIPAKFIDGSSNVPLVVMTLQRLLLSGSDVFYELNEMRTPDLGHHWSEPSPQRTFSRTDFGQGREITVCDFTPKWHRGSGQLLGTGQTVVYHNNEVMKVRPRATAYAVYDTEKGSWKAWKRLKMPTAEKFENAGAGSVQRYDLPDGDILLPIYFKSPAASQYSVAVARCTFDGETLAYVEHGNEMTVEVKRGFAEPSITHYGDRYFLTLRNDEMGYVCSSGDGLHFTEPIPWRFNDGELLGNYNTQQHWVTHHLGLYLVYTRRGLQNDHVFRHRAPLMIARVDPDHLTVMRETEQELVPERGARLGNFGVVDVSPEETWITVTEWMQPAGVEKYGSNNAIFIAKLKWRTRNRLITPYP